MPFLRTSTVFSSLTGRAAASSLRQPFAIRSLSSTPSRCAQGYGDGEGDPKGENPQQQGASNRTKHNAEHPGPASPAESKGSSTKSPEEASAQSGGSRSKDAEEKRASPKVSDKNVPGKENTEAKQAEVEQHNKEFYERHDRAPKAAADKVDKKFWSGRF